jgi:hypothetical protein
LSPGFEAAWVLSAEQGLEYQMHSQYTPRGGMSVVILSDDFAYGIEKSFVWVTNFAL